MFSAFFLLILKYISNSTTIMSYSIEINKNFGVFFTRKSLKTCNITRNHPYTFLPNSFYACLICLFLSCILSFCNFFFHIDFVTLFILQTKSTIWLVDSPLFFICYSNNSFRTCWWTELLFLPFLNKSTKLTRTPCPLLYILLLQDVPTHCLFSISLFHNIFFSLFSLFSSSYVPISYPKRFTFHSPSSHNKFLFKFNSFFVVIFKSSLSKSQWKNNEFPWNWILLDLVQFTTHF